ncbi:MAG: LysR substrate-binding domain-containing protein [Aquabacterium sp.]
MNLKQLHYFVQVAEHGSFSKAAQVLRIAQPALSRQVRLLETDLRETLLLRNGRGVEPTDAGRRLLEHATGILQQVDEARADIGSRRDEPVGRITIGLPPSLARQLTLPLIEAFRRDCPQARLAIVEGLSAHMAEWISSGRVDIGLLYNPDAQAGLEIKPVLEEPLCLVQLRSATVPATAKGSAGRRLTQLAAQERGLLHRATALPLRRLADHALIMPERAHVIRRLVETQCALHGVALDVAWEVSSVPAILDLVCAGHGQAVLPLSSVTASPWAARLQARAIEQPRLTSVLCMVASVHRRASPLARQVARLLTSGARSLQAASRAAPARAPRRSNVGR